MMNMNFQHMLLIQPENLQECVALQKTVSDQDCHIGRKAEHQSVHIGKWLLKKVEKMTDQELKTIIEDQKLSKHIVVI